MQFKLSALPLGTDKVEAGSALQFGFVYAEQDTDPEQSCVQMQKDLGSVDHQVSAALIVCQDQALIVRRALTESHAPGMLELPGGGQEREDSANYFRTVGREIAEEVGLNVDNAKRVQPLNGFCINYKNKITGQINFLVEFDQMPAVTLSNEIAEALWVEQQHVLTLIEADQMHSPGELAGLVHFLRNWLGDH